MVTVRYVCGQVIWGRLNKISDNAGMFPVCLSIVPMLMLIWNNLLTLSNSHTKCGCSWRMCLFLSTMTCMSMLLQTLTTLTQTVQLTFLIFMNSLHHSLMNNYISDLATLYKSSPTSTGKFCCLLSLQLRWVTVPK